ncbi:uncharacterized protein F4822DRAFT_319433 [Hypoxylon trugodes]|uniref:uncharacterized protein n=1 Tax=Hypoxylon trugodes TaxID=326681 RepID=UPI00218CD63C|nr:uncharacterized protein F4822DRAFT_319433 [Hypoxylon trugodes]KAI1386531.1 hypothetical protein F4822DRAFT_319433 [Hypoxylon trugodes]
MAEVPVVQILNKKEYFKQALVSLPNETLPPLADSSLRIRTEILCVTSNNFSYCKVGELFHWWDIHRIPASTPAPYNDTSVYGRINCWGYAKVIDSTFADVPKGSYLYGYLPIGTLPLDFQVKAGNVPNQVIVTEPYRQQQLPVYNRYFVHPPSLSQAIEAKNDALGYDSLLRPMYLTAHLMSGFMFPPDPTQSVQLTPEQASLSGAAVIVFAPGSKVGLAFTHRLRAQSRPQSKPAAIIGVASQYSRSFVQSTGLYDGTVASTTDDPLTILSSAGASKEHKVTIFDFGGRGGAAWKWAGAIVAQYPKTQFVVIGGEVSEPSADWSPSKPPAGVDVAAVMADTLLTAAINKVGEKEYFDDYEATWAVLRKEGFRGFKVNWGEGMEAVKEGWDKFAKNEAKADEGLVFKI